MKKEKKNLLSQIITEYKQVIWPSKSEVFQVTIVVLLITLFISIMVLAFDISFRTVMQNFQNIVKSLLG